MRTTAAVFLFLFAVPAVAAALTHLGTRSAEADLDDDGVYALRGHHARNVVLGEPTCAAAGGRVGRAPIASPLAHLV